jgi:dienelactone hydrolase
VDVEDLAMAYEWLVSQPFVDAARSGLLGTCVGGSFALMAAARPRIRDHVGFVGAFSPYASIRALARDIVSATWLRNGTREPWAVDPLTRKVFVHTLTAHLEPDEAGMLRETMAMPDGEIDAETLSPEGQAVYPLLRTLPADEVDGALARLPDAVQSRLDAMSPVGCLPEMRAPIIVLMHDHDDPVIPRTESLQIRDALAGRQALGYTEFVMFRHLDPSKVQMHLPPLLRELWRFCLSLYPIFRQAAA